MLEILQICPICRASSFKPILKCRDYSISKEEFEIVQCLTCGLRITNPRPDAQSIGKYYESEDYVSHSNTQKGLINKLYHIAKKKAIKNKISLIESLNPSGKALLDIGCGTGSFIGEIQKKGWTVLGVEPNEGARKIARKNYSIDVIPDNEIINQKVGSFNVITLWHVLEHVHNLRDRVEEIKKLLSTNGLAIIAVPNPESWDAKHYGKFWAAYDVPRHLYHFSPVQIKKLFSEVGFVHLKSFPMKMDSYYVSMLSEKYQSRSLGMIKAAINGFLSNLKAKNDAEKFSSVIYVFQKIQ